MSTPIQIVQADLTRPEHGRAVVELTAAYARDEMGGRGALSTDVLERLVPALQQHPTTLILLAYHGEHAIGIATCFLGFSTFAARPLINIHDLAVLPEHRGKGVGRALLEGVQQQAQARGCVKLTLEVYEHNLRARRIYEGAGFSCDAGEGCGDTLFYSKRV